MTATTNQPSSAQYSPWSIFNKSIISASTSTIVCLSMNFILKRFHHCKCVPVFVFNRKFGKINIGITILRQTNTRKKIGTNK